MGWLMEAAPIAATTAISEARQSSIFFGGGGTLSPVMTVCA